MLNYVNTKERTFKIGKVDAFGLANKYGTPLYAYSTDIIRKKYLLLKANIPENIDIFYSIKANPNLSICSFINSIGAGAEISSSGELFAALKSGFSPKKIIFDGPGKTDEELKYAIKNGVNIINVESVSELKRINSIAKNQNKKVNVCLRINPRLRLETKILMGSGSQKFGIDEEKAGSVINFALGLNNINLLGIHIYSGSQITSNSELLKNIENTIRIACEYSKKFNFPLKCINLGGGIGIPYDKKLEVDIKKFGEGLSSIIKKKSILYNLKDTKFILELGRYLTAEAGIYLTKVIDVKESRGRKYVIVDGGINHSFIPI